MSEYSHCEIKTPVGMLRLVARGDALAAILWEKENRSLGRYAVSREDAGHPVLVRAAKQLAEYFEGERTEFDLPLEMEGTAFQKEVWGALTKIPFGKTWSYVEVARAIGRPAACRAVGAANGANPIPIVVPCHRVIGASGKLTGFGGGLGVKSYLLELETKGLFARG